ncbi:MAG: three-Cys-motif partner protein TcmP [Rhizomicrobium sp.]
MSRQLNRHALHFAFLDPFNLTHLPFTILETLAKFRRMDMLIHVSAQDLQRNLRRYSEMQGGPLDRVAPGWRGAVDLHERDDIVRQKFLHHWLGLIRKLDMAPSDGIELVSGSRKQRLYWLVFVSRHDLAGEFWNKIRNVTGQGRLDL